MKRVLLSLQLFILIPLGLGSEVVIEQNESGSFTLVKDGEPFIIRGAGGSDHLDVLKEHGGNSIRTWGIETLEIKEDGKSLLDRCQARGISVTAGIWIGHERHGFDYSDPTQIKKQRDAVREAVRKYRDHPALLMWGLGNEMEGPASVSETPHIWKELNELAAIIREEDPNHPVMTVIAGAASTKIKGILEHYPNLDVLGVNAYAAAPGVASAIQTAGWKKPFVLSEFGPSGHWEVPATDWGAPIEPDSQDKAAAYYAAQKLTMEDAADICLGTYCFLWGQKQETTSTWYGMFHTSGDKLPAVDAMCRAWTGAWPKNRCPRIEAIHSDLKNAVVAPGQLHIARSHVQDPNGDALEWEWKVTEESTDTKVGGDAESIPPSFPDSIAMKEAGQVVIRTPEKPGSYRLFLTVRDGNGAASVGNICFQVSP